MVGQKIPGTPFCSTSGIGKSGKWCGYMGRNSETLRMSTWKQNFNCCLINTWHSLLIHMQKICRLYSFWYYYNFWIPFDPLPLGKSYQYTFLTKSKSAHHYFLHGNKDRHTFGGKCGHISFFSICQQNALNGTDAQHLLTAYCLTRTYDLGNFAKNWWCGSKIHEYYPNRKLSPAEWSPVEFFLAHHLDLTGWPQGCPRHP